LLLKLAAVVSVTILSPYDFTGAVFISAFLPAIPLDVNRDGKWRRCTPHILDNLMLRLGLGAPLRDELADVTKCLKRRRNRKKVVHQNNKQKAFLKKSVNGHSKMQGLFGLSL
jgi:hypothetical protein